METGERLISKILVLDDSMEHAQLIKQFCEENNLIGLKVSKNNLMHVLRKNIDLGAILYSEDYGDSLEETTNIALKVHLIRPELPIIVRRNKEATLEGFSEPLQRIFCAVYVASDMSVLRKVLDRYIFSLAYPNALVRG